MLRSRKALYFRDWADMIARCENPKLKAWKNYGARGISVFEDWRKSFTAFLLYVGNRPSVGYSIDRFPNQNGNYEPGNVRWATAIEQMMNQRRNRIVFFRGRILPVTHAARLAGLSPSLVLTRAARGWPEADWFEESSKKKRHNWK